MPSTSSRQRRFMGMVLAAKRHQLTKPSPAVKKAASGMTETQVREFAHKPMRYHKRSE